MVTGRAAVRRSLRRQGTGTRRRTSCVPGSRAPPFPLRSSSAPPFPPCAEASHARKSSSNPNSIFAAQRGAHEAQVPCPRQTVHPHAGSLPPPRCARSAARFAPGARQTAQPTARSRVAHERSNATLPTNSGARGAPHASRRARGRQFSRMPGTTTTVKSWMARSRSANKMADLREPTERARAFHGL